MVQVERATVADVEVISMILGEIESYYGGEAVPGDVGQVRAALFDGIPAATVFLAREDEDVLGLASFSLLWPAAGADTSLFLKELFVRAPYRRRGVARALMAAVRAEATAAGCSRLEWTADRDNPPALELYAALGFEENSGKAFYRWVE